MSRYIGDIDGKHIAMKNSALSGSLWHNYKAFFSMVLLAICNARYNFSAIDVVQDGSNNDAGILLNSKMVKKKLKKIPFKFLLQKRLY